MVKKSQIALRSIDLTKLLCMYLGRLLLSAIISNIVQPKEGIKKGGV